MTRHIGFDVDEVDPRTAAAAFRDVKSNRWT